MAVAMGGGSGAVAASAHAGCDRFRATDPLITGVTRRSLASSLGAPDTSGVIPQARWTRAMAFETMVRNEKFASRIAATTAGQLGLRRPKVVVTANADEDLNKTANVLNDARVWAEVDAAATLIAKPAVPFPGFSSSSATAVLPDFLIVLPRSPGELGAWLVVGDAKDYERVRSNIDDERMLKGFLQVALGAEALQRWSKRSSSIDVHRFGVLAVPRNSSLHPVAVTEDLADHRKEVAMRLEQRIEDSKRADWRGNPVEFVAHVNARFDPATCTSCSLFYYCRSELRNSSDPTQLLVELGVPQDSRPSLLPLVSGGGEVSPLAPAGWVSRLQASMTGVPQRTGRHRIDPVGLPGTVNVVLVKSDAVALGAHGISIQVVSAEGSGPWRTTVFDAPHTDSARRTMMGLLGRALSEALRVVDAEDVENPPPIHIIFPDKATADLLASIADVLGSSEVSRLRYMRDIAMNRPPLTFDGEPAKVPEALTEEQRLAISFLLEDDRARAFAMRTTTVDVTSVLSNYVISGGPLVESSRLDYVVEWCVASEEQPVNFRDLQGLIESTPHTPGAKLSRELSDEIHEALLGKSGRPSNLERYEALVLDELAYKRDVFERALEALSSIPDSTLRSAVRTLEADAQKIWRLRWAFQAFDLIRFGRTSRHWRNRLVDVVQATHKCAQQLSAILDPTWADEGARSAGTKELAVAEVVSLSPLEIEIASRRFSDGTSAALLHVNGKPTAEAEGISTKMQSAAIAVDGMPIGILHSASEDSTSKRFFWDLPESVQLRVGDEIVIGATEWFNGKVNVSHLKVTRPSADAQMVPKASCEPESYSESPSEHMWCCRPHVEYEAAISDRLAERREAGEMNPTAWPPVRDGDEFDVVAEGDPEPALTTSVEQPAGLTVDDVE